METPPSPPQQLQPQTPLGQESGTHVPLLQVSLQAQVGLQQVPMYRVVPMAHVQVPPQPSLLPQVPSLGQLGVQQLPP